MVKVIVSEVVVVYRISRRRRLIPGSRRDDEPSTHRRPGLECIQSKDLCCALACILEHEGKVQSKAVPWQKRSRSCSSSAISRVTSVRGSGAIHRQGPFNAPAQGRKKAGCGGSQKASRLPKTVRLPLVTEPFDDFQDSLQISSLFPALYTLRLKSRRCLIHEHTHVRPVF